VCLCNENVFLFDVVLDMQIQLSLVGFASAIMERKKAFHFFGNKIDLSTFCAK
jgi:hypothetical protein